MKRISLLIIALLATTVTAFAQQKGKVTFTLVDSATKQGVIGAVVELYPTAKPTDKRYYTSNVDGSVSLPPLNYGEYAILATSLGMNSVWKCMRFLCLVHIARSLASGF